MLFDYYVTLLQPVLTVIIINEMALEVLVHDVAIWVVLRELGALDREAFPVVVDRSPVEGVSCPVALAWAVPQMAEGPENVAGLLFPEVVVAGLVEGDLSLIHISEPTRPY